MPSAGEIVRAADVARTIHAAECTSAKALTTTSNVDITGATVTFTTSKDAVECTAMMTAEVVATSAGYSNVIVGIDVDGAEKEVCQFSDDVTRNNGSVVCTFTLATAGSHTVKMVGRVSTASGTATVQAGRSQFVATVYDATS